MPHKGKKKFTSKETVLVRITKKRKKKRRLKVNLTPNKGTIVIKNLSFNATEGGVREYFSKFGDVCEVKILQSASGDPVGRGIVQFTKEKSAMKAIKLCNGKDFMERRMVVDRAVSQSPKEINSNVSQKARDDPEACVAMEECAEGSSHVEAGKKRKASATEVVQNTETKKCKKIKNAKKGRLIVRNLPFKVTDSILRKHFEKYGEITEVKLLHKDDGRLVGCGFIQFAKKNSAAKAILTCSGKPLLGRTIIVDWAVPKSVFTTNESSAKEEIEIKEEVQDEVEVAVSSSASDVGACDVQPSEIKTEPLSDESEGDTNSDISGSSDSEVQDKETTGEGDESDVKPKLEGDIKKPKVISNDVSEGRTVFVKNVPFSASNDDLKTCMEQFGPVIYALICMDPLTEHSKGTAFIKFQTKESAELCLASGTELTLLDHTLDVFRALNKDQLQQKANVKHEVQKNRDSRNLYLVKEGVVLAGSRAAVGVSMADMEKRLQLERWKSQMLRNLNMFVSRYRLVVHNVPPSWDDARLRRLFLQHAGPDAVIKEARIMRDMRNVDVQGIGKSKEFGFVFFTTHDHALKALRNINNNPNIFTSAKRPIVAFSIENKAIMNIKQKRLEKSQAKNPLYTGKCDSKRARASRKNEDSGKTRTENDSVIAEETEEFVGMTAKPGNKKLRTRFGLRTQAELHKQSVRKDKRRQKIKRNFDQQRQRMKEKMQDPQPKKGVKRKLDDDDDDVAFSKLVSQYKKRLMTAPVKKWWM